jgi:hypothetical protein
MPLDTGSIWQLITTIDTTTVSFLQLGNIVMVKGGARFIFLTTSGNVVTPQADIGIDDGISLMTLLGDEYLVVKDAANPVLLRVFKEAPK